MIPLNDLENLIKDLIHPRQVTKGSHLMTGGSGIHLFYVRFFQWISIAVSFEKEISQCDDDFFFVCNKSTARIFIKELGYAEGRIVDESEVESFFK